MKKMKKLFAVLLALAMVLGMSMTAFAEPDNQTPHKPIPTDSAKITVNGVATGATVKAFKIVEGQWNDSGFYGYKVVDGYTISNISEPSSEDIITIANSVDKENGVVIEEEKDSEGKGTGVYSGTFEVGTYLILVTANGDQDMTAYNPMIASVAYLTKNGSGSWNVPQNGSVSAMDEFKVGEATAYAKHLVPTIDKKIVDPLEPVPEGSPEGTQPNNKGNDTAIGDVITFEVETAFPSYSDAYTDVEFEITDTLSTGLSFKTDAEDVTYLEEGKPVISILVKDKPVDSGKYRVNVKGGTMTISFDSSYILKNRGEKVVVQYTAALNDQAGLNFDKNTNTVKAEYTNNPTTKDKGTTEEKKTYHYTFGIDASINGSWEEVTKELLKTGEEILKPGSTEKAPLNGATFTLKNKTTGKVYTTISGVGEVGEGKDFVVNAEEKVVDKDGKAVFTDEGKLAADIVKPEGMSDGFLKFTGLDAGEYTLQETKAPDGYSLNNAEIPVSIKATYNVDGTLSGYTITVDGRTVEENGEVKDSQYTATYQKNESTGEMETAPEGDSNTQAIPNTKLSSLPSTGGIGTTIFTIAGCLIMIVAAGLFFASRRKSVAK